jgi:hypothetical protein
MSAITDHSSRCWRRYARAAMLMLVALAGIATCSVRPALADGDPASDVLATETLFLAQDAGVPGPQQVQLASLLGTARRIGLSLRVAVIASPADLGSVTELWREPQTYARFLGQELSLVDRGPHPPTLLVVMPNGFGVYRPGKVPPALARALTGIPPAGTASRLGGVTLTAIQRVAAAAGHELPVPSASGAATPSSASSDTVPWIVFAAGLVLIVAAWTLSLRARPLQLTSVKDRTS